MKFLKYGRNLLSVSQIFKLCTTIFFSKKTNLNSIYSPTVLLVKKLKTTLFIVCVIFGASANAEEVPTDYDQQNIEKIAEAVNVTFSNYLVGVATEDVKREINQAIAKSIFLARDIVLKHSPQSKAALDIQKIANAFKFQNLPTRVNSSPIPIDLIITALDVTKDFTLNLMVTQNPYFCDDCATYFKNRKVITWLIDMAYLDVKSIILAQFNPIIAAREAIVGNVYILGDISLNVALKALEAEDAVSQAKYSEILGEVMSLEATYLEKVTKANNGDEKLLYLNEFETKCMKYGSWAETFDMYHWFGNSEVRTKVSSKCKIRRDAIEEFDWGKLERYKQGIEINFFEAESAKVFRESYFPTSQWDSLAEYCDDHCSPSPYTDVLEDYVYYKHIKWSYVEGLTNGFQNTLEFRPEEFATVGQVLLVLSRYLSNGEVNSANQSDLLGTYRKFLSDEVGISLPSSITNLVNDRNINRKELAQLLTSSIYIRNPKASVLVTGGGGFFTDTTALSSQDINSVSFILDRNVMEYSSSYGLFQPWNDVTRGEMSSSIFNLSNYLKSVHFLLNSTKYPRNY